MDPPMPDEKLRTHERAIQVVLEELAKRRFVTLAHHGKRDEPIIVISRDGRNFRREVRVRGGTAPSTFRYFLAGENGTPPKNPDQFFTLVNLVQYYLPQIYVLANEEARSRYRLDRENVGSFEIEDLRPDADRLEHLDPETNPDT